MNSEKISLKPPKYISLTLDETIRLIVCVILDVVEYAVTILLSPLIGDMLDIVGIGASVIMFEWIGLVSMLEFIPMADFFPVFILTWFLWYYMKKEGEKSKEKKIKEKCERS